MNPDQNYREFFCKIYCWRSPINSYGNPFVKFKRNNFKKDFLVKKNYIVIICKMIPEQNLWEFTFKKEKVCVPDPNPHASLVRAVYEA